VRAFLRFWYDFVVGDDWTIAVAVVALLGGAALLVELGAGAWWWMTVSVVVTLGWSVWRGAHPRTRD